jgi:hypothetical protein
MQQQAHACLRCLLLLLLECQMPLAVMPLALVVEVSRLLLLSPA